MSIKGESLESKRKNALEIIKEWMEELEKQYPDSNKNIKEINQDKHNQYWTRKDE